MGVEVEKKVRFCWEAVVLDEFEARQFEEGRVVVWK